MLIKWWLNNIWIGIYLVLRYVIIYEFTDKLEEKKRPQISKRLHGITCQNEEISILHVKKKEEVLIAFFSCWPLESLILKVIILGAFAKLWKATTSFVTSVCLSVYPSVWNNSAPTRRTLMKFDIWGTFENLPRNPKCY